MPVYTIHYNSQNRYDSVVFEAVLEFLILPETNNNQKLVKFDIKTNTDTPYYISKNNYGFKLIRFRFTDNLDLFEINVNIDVDKKNINPFENAFLSAADEQKILKSHENNIQNYFYLNPGLYTKPTESWIPPKIKKDENVFNFAQRVNDLVYYSMTYDLSNASIERKLDEVIESSTGVCQDYAHLMIAMLRANNIPARYVSGYLNQGKHNQGDGAIHAWVEVFIPGVGWLGFDPTNKLLEDRNYIKISHGVDLSECTSLKGVVKSPGSNSTEYNVQVKEKQTKQVNQ